MEDSRLKNLRSVKMLKPTL